MRDEVIEQMALGSPALTGLAKTGASFSFPQADDATVRRWLRAGSDLRTPDCASTRYFAVTAASNWRRRNCERSNSLIGTALSALTEDNANQDALKTSLGTLTRVLDAVNWHTISKDKPEAWLYFYEDFLEVYDNALRKLTGSYYTPPEVVSRW